jgi:uncharacterized protein
VAADRSDCRRSHPAPPSGGAFSERPADGWDELADGAAAIVHLAGESLAEWPWTEEKKRRIRDSRVRSTRAVAEAIRRAATPPPVLLQSSGINIYGDRGDRVVDESEPSGSGFLAEVCVEWEAASDGVEELGVRRALLRTAVVLSAEGGALPKMALPFKLFVGGPIGRGDQWLPWIHLADQVAAIRFLLDHPAAATVGGRYATEVRGSRAGRTTTPSRSGRRPCRPIGGDRTFTDRPPRWAAAT